MFLKYVIPLHMPTRKRDHGFSDMLRNTCGDRQVWRWYELKMRTNVWQFRIIFVILLQNSWLWVHSLISVMLDFGALVMVNTLTSRDWLPSLTARCLPRNVSVASLAVAALASRWLLKCSVPTTTSRATHVRCSRTWRYPAIHRSNSIWTSTQSFILTWLILWLKRRTSISLTW